MSVPNERDRAQKWYAEKLLKLPPNYQPSYWMNVVELLAEYAANERKAGHDAAIEQAAQTSDDVRIFTNDYCQAVRDRISKEIRALKQPAPEKAEEKA